MHITQHRVIIKERTKKNTNGKESEKEEKKHRESHKNKEQTCNRKRRPGITIIIVMVSRAEIIIINCKSDYKL